MTQNHNHTSYKKIKLTHHSLQRACERLNLSTQDEVKQIAGKARFKGINIAKLTIFNYETLGISYEELVALKKNFSIRTNSTKLFYYKDYVYIFVGDKAMTLKTIVPIKEYKKHKEL